MNPNDLFKIQDAKTRELYLGNISELSDVFSGAASSSGSYLVSGGEVIWRGNLDFTIKSAVYYILGVQYTSQETNVTLSAADGSNPRIDTFYVDVDGLAGVITGTPAADPQEPSIDPATQLRLTITQINAAATVPADVSDTTIYNENTGAPGEWNTSTNNATAVDFAATTDPSLDTIHIDVNGDGNAHFLKFTPASPATINAATDILVMSILIDDVWDRAKYLSVQFYNSSTNTLLNANLRPGSFGFDGNLVGVYQEVTIPISAMYPNQSITYDDIIQLNIVAPPQLHSASYQVDNIYLQSGISTPSVTTFKPHVFQKTLWVDGNGNDETAVRGEFNKPFKTVKLAEQAAVAGDTIIVMPGTYVEQNLGKDGVNYYISSGATLKSIPSTGYKTANIFSDKGSAMTLRIDCRGRLETDNGSVLYAYNANTVVYLYADEIIQNNFSTNNHAILLESTATLHITYNYAFVNADNYFFINASANTIYCSATGYTDVRTQIISVAGGFATFLGNFAASNSTNSFENSFGARSGAYLKIKTNYFDSNNSSSTYNGTFDIRDGATIDFEGYMRVSNNNWVPLDIDRTNGGGSRLIIRNSHIIYEDVSANQALIRLFQSTSRCEIYDSIIENRNQLAGSHGIIANISTAGSIGSIDLKNTTILLHTTAVGLGAKAIQSTGSLDYRMFTDTLSNGAFDGTNLISSTIGIVDANAKSD